MTVTRADLPDTIAIFPLGQAIVLPRGRLPLNIFEPRYLQMVDDALRGNRVIGMIQPKSGLPKSMLHDTGCLGRLTSWSETGDGRVLITLTGVSRFRVAEELVVTTPYRQVRADYAPYAEDLTPARDDTPLDRSALFDNLERYLKGHKLEADWTAIAEAPAESLINSLAMICPFDVAEKQALIDARSLAERADVLTALIEMAVAGSAGTRLQ